MMGKPSNTKLVLLAVLTLLSLLSVNFAANATEAPMLAADVRGAIISLRVDGWMGAEFEEPDLPPAMLNFPTKNPRNEKSANLILKMNKENARRYKLRAFWYSFGEGCKEGVIPDSICKPPEGFRVSRLLIAVSGNSLVPLVASNATPLLPGNPRIFVPQAQAIQMGLQCNPLGRELSCAFRFGMEKNLFGFLYFTTTKEAGDRTLSVLDFTQDLMNYLVRVDARSY